MIDVGDLVVCIKPFDRRCILPYTPNSIIPQVGCQYTVYEIDGCSCGCGYLMLYFIETPTWGWLIDHFRKVRPIEEPKYKQEDTPIKNLPKKVPEYV